MLKCTFPQEVLKNKGEMISISRTYELISKKSEFMLEARVKRCPILLGDENKEQ